MPAVQPWTKARTSLRVRFLLCEMGITAVPSSKGCCENSMRLWRSRAWYLGHHLSCLYQGTIVWPGAHSLVSLGPSLLSCVTQGTDPFPALLNRIAGDQMGSKPQMGPGGGLHRTEMLDSSAPRATRNFSGLGANCRSRCILSGPASSFHVSCWPVEAFEVLTPHLLQSFSRSVLWKGLVIKQEWES